MEAQQDKRRFARLNALVDVVYTRYTTEEKKELSITRNISKGGICLIAYEELKLDEVLSLNIYFPEDNAPVSLTGKVVWVKEFVMGEDIKHRRFDAGIEFIEVNEEDLNKINKYVFGHLS